MWDPLEALWDSSRLCRIHWPPVSCLFDHRIATWSQHLKPRGPATQPLTLMARRRRRGAHSSATHAISTPGGAPVVQLNPPAPSVVLRFFLENPKCVHCTGIDTMKWTEEVGRRCYWCYRPICLRHSHSRYWWQCANDSSCWKVCEQNQTQQDSQRRRRGSRQTAAQQQCHPRKWAHLPQYCTVHLNSNCETDSQ